MIVLKADAMLKAVFQKTIRVMGTNVEWNDIFIIHNNSIILQGKLKSLVFNFDKRKVFGTVVDIPVKEEARLMLNNQMLENALNMNLYIFGKWGQIKGLTVEKNYAQLQKMINNVLEDIFVTAEFTKDRCRFYQDDKRITFEEVIEEFLKLMKPDFLQEEENDEVTAERENAGPAGKGKKGHKKTAGKVSRAADEPEEDDDEEEDEYEQLDPRSRKYHMGLWHNMVWESQDKVFKKEKLSKLDRLKSRFGSNFYISNYQCPECGQLMYMGVYPEGKEFRIETDEGNVLLARTFTCRNCKKFYTPRPYQMIGDGLVYCLDFEDDKVAYQDYLELAGEQAERTANCNFNMYETQLRRERAESDKESEGKRGIKELETFFKNMEDATDDEILEQKDRLDCDFYTEKSIKKYDGRLAKEMKKRHITDTGVRKKKAQKKPANSTMIGEANKEIRRASDRLHEARQTENEKLDCTTRKQKQVASAENSSDRNTDKTAERVQEFIDREDSRATETASQKTSDQETRDQKTHDQEMRNLRKNDAASGNSKTDAISTQKTESLRGTGHEAEHVENQKEKRDFEQKEDQGQPATQSVLMQDQKNEIYEESMNQEELEKRVRNVENASYEQMDEVLEQVRKTELPEPVKKPLISRLLEWMKNRGKKELEVLETHFPEQMTRQQYQKIRRKVERYREADTTDMLKKLEQQRDEIEQNEIHDFVKEHTTGTDARSAVWNAFQALQEQDFDDRNKEPVLKRLKYKLTEMDEAALSELTPDLAEMTFDEGMAAYEQISEGNFLPELKMDILARIDRKLREMKMDECEHLVHKLIRDTAWLRDTYSGVHMFDVRRMDEHCMDNDAVVIRNAKYSYAAGIGAYEYPLMVMDTSFGEGGKKGFLLTPDHLFYRCGLTSGVLNVREIEKVSAGAGLFNKGLFASYHNVGDLKICGQPKFEKTDRKAYEDFVVKLNDFIAYLHEKPESRSLAYMVQDKHDVKCCYRCGFVYKTGNVCPKCGNVNYD